MNAVSFFNGRYIYERGTFSVKNGIKKAIGPQGEASVKKLC